MMIIPPPEDGEIKGVRRDFIAAGFRPAASQALTPTDEKLEKLIDALVQLVGMTHIIELGYTNLAERRKHIQDIASARAALREYVSEAIQKASEEGFWHGQNA